MPKKISLIIAAIYLLCALIFGGLVWFLITLVLLFVALAMIWFGEEMGDYIGGFHRIGKPYITKRSPGGLVSLFGWIFLLLPIIVVLLKLF
ncbi:hypothetical protein AMJ83_07270 [candidate division WOR_3 bacterium SM23_42]|uniref:Uncharacterized protein n=1 Tax=candidate division WOR_3 bacterium SM23_42 TaxID=1703779 RepID=A0A0S8FTT0_UNCW3|nr:MAG: hypothetical protein AMJ83_07270 [candidate division WOR_3 bacterium SM23_42]